jgi:hypothetical protein
MSGFAKTTPGGVWHNVNSKALSYGWASIDGFGGAMHHTAVAGGLRHSLLFHHAPMILARQKPDNAPYMSHMGGASWGDTFKNILGKIVSLGQAAHESGLTNAVGNLINNAVKPAGPAKAPMPVEPGATPGINNGLNQGPAPKRPRFGGGWF